MKTKTKTFRVPAAWHELRPWQIDRLTKLMTMHGPKYYLDRGRGVMLLALLADEKGEPLDEQDCIDVTRNKKNRAALADAAAALDFIKETPPLPLRPETIAGRRALRADFQGVRFGTFLRATGLWSLLLRLYDPADTDLTQEERIPVIAAANGELFDLLYPPVRRKGKEPRPLADEEKQMLMAAVVLWMQGLQAMLAGMYPNLYTAAPTKEKKKKEDDPLHHALAVALGGGDEEETDSDDDPDRTARLMVRTLTGGDVTKTLAVLRTDTHTCLQEIEERVLESRKVKASRKA